MQNTPRPPRAEDQRTPPFSVLSAVLSVSVVQLVSHSFSHPADTIYLPSSSVRDVDANGEARTIAVFSSRYKQNSPLTKRATYGILAYKEL